MRIVKVIIVMLLSMVLFTGCSGCETPQTVYLIGEGYTFETIKVKLENDEAKEQFVLYYEVLAQDESTHYFSFTIINNTETLKNSNQFSYKDNLESEFSFNENGYYEFSNSKTFYISYKEANEEVKNLIKDKNCSIELPIGTFTFS